jgi:predicted nucleic acid-binding protein
MRSHASESETRLPRIFLDTNVLLDYLYFRSEEALAVEYIFNVCMHDTLDCYIAAHSLTNLFYICRKDFSEAARKQIVLNFCAFCHVKEISGRIIESAIDGGYSDDLEDALQIQCAIESRSDYILTRDPDGFAKSPIPVLLPHTLIHKLKL